MVKPVYRRKSIGTKVSDEEYARLEALAGGRAMSEWAREVLLRELDGRQARPRQAIGGKPFPGFIGRSADLAEVHRLTERCFTTGSPTIEQPHSCNESVEVKSPGLFNCADISHVLRDNDLHHPLRHRPAEIDDSLREWITCCAIYDKLTLAGRVVLRAASRAIPLLTFGRSM
jgi:hypothetical protein